MKAISGSKLSFTFCVEEVCSKVTLIWDKDRELLDIYHKDKYASTISLERYFNGIHNAVIHYPRNETTHAIHKWLLFLIKKVNYNISN